MDCRSLATHHTHGVMPVPAPALALAALDRHPRPLLHLHLHLPPVVLQEDAALLSQ